MEQDGKVVPLESKASNEGCQQSTETKDSGTATNRRPETEIVTSQCKKESVEKEVDDHVVVEAVAIRPEVKVESRSAVDEIAKAETEVAGRQEETPSSVDKALSVETSEKATASAADSKRDSAPIDPGIISAVQSSMTAAVPEPETSKTMTSGRSSKETVRSQQTKSRRSNSVESDKEISEILRNAPPPSVLSEEEEEEEGENEDAEEGMDEPSEAIDEMGTVIIMKKTFTESIKPDQEFKPIADDEFCPHPTPSAAPPCRLEHPVPSSTTAATTGQLSNASDGKDAAAAVDSASKTESKEEEEDGNRSILSRARNEARDLTSELRRLQYFLENLSSFTELELASLHPDDSSSSSSSTTTQIDSAQSSAIAYTADAAAVVEDKNTVLSSVDNV